MNLTTFPTHPVLLVDDEAQFLLSVNLSLNSEGINNVVQCQDSRDVMSKLSEQEFSVVVLDMRMPHLSGRELLPMIVRDFPDLPTIIITAVNEVKTAVKCMKQGAFDYLVKPVDKARLVTTVRRAIADWQLRDENRRLKNYLLSDELEHPEVFSELITQDPVMQSIFQYAEVIAVNPVPVLITGETGVGKGLIARIIHQLSGRTGELISVNVAGLDDHLFSDTLFGHKKGAFTGADTARQGLIERASGGTLFLDEIGDLHIESQVKLLRLLQEGEYYPLGADVSKGTDARIIVATNQEIESSIAEGTFREDLYYRLQTHHVHLPPLRDRRNDLPLLIEHFLQKAATQLGKNKPTPPPELFTLLSTHPFPGNIRELEGLIFDAVSRHQGGVLSMASFRDKIGQRPPAHHTSEAERGGDQASPLFTEVLPTLDALPALKDAEQLLIEEALKRSDGNQRIAAQLLGMSREALNKRLRRSRPSPA